MPHLLRSVSVAAARVDAHNHRLHVVVVHKVLKVFAHLATCYIVVVAEHRSSLWVLHDVALCIVYGNLAAFYLAALHVEHVVQSELLYVVALVELHHLLHGVLHLVAVHHAVNHLCLHKRLCSLQREIRVGVAVERVDAYAAALRYGVADIAPCAVDEGLGLQAVGIAHLLLGEGLGCTLECAHLNNLPLHAELRHEVLVEHGLCTDAVPVDCALWVDVHFVGYRRHVVSALRVEVAVSHNPLAALAEVGECVAYLLQRSVVGCKCARFYVYAFYVVVSLSLLYSRENVVESAVQRVVACEHAERVLRSLLADSSRKIEHEHRVLLHVLCCVARRYHADDAHHADNAHHDEEAEHTDHRGKHVFDEVFHKFFFF